MGRIDSVENWDNYLSSPTQLVNCMKKHIMWPNFSWMISLKVHLHICLAVSYFFLIHIYMNIYIYIYIYMCCLLSQFCHHTVSVFVDEKCLLSSYYWMIVHCNFILYFLSSYTVWPQSPTFFNSKNFYIWILCIFIQYYLIRFFQNIKRS